MSSDKLPEDKTPYEELTWREQEVLALLAERFTNREIADRLHLAESTVKDYVSNILGKLFVKNRRQAVVRGKKLGLLTPTEKEPTDPVSKLPSFPSPFIGRLDELNTIKRQLKETRLLTISGPGGVGKTRLAIQAAMETTANFKHGSFLVSLAPISSSDKIAQTIAEALGFPLATAEDPRHQLIRYLQQKQLLLVLDNFEHLLEGTPILEQILQAAPNVKVLLTSRERLNLQGEMNYQIRGMAMPDSGEVENILGFDAIRFFIQTARRSRSHFNPSTNDLKKIAAVCKSVQALPLAIELAVAWLNVLSLDEIKAEIEQSFDILSSEMRGLPDRHRSIRLVFEHSWSMLEPAEQEIFARISIFRGGFTREAAQQVTSATLSALSRLVNKSVLRYDPGIGRFEVHELLRQYAQERLEIQPEKHQSALESHAAYYANFMQEKWKELRDDRQIDAHNEIDVDIENIRAAWHHYVELADAAQMKKFLNSFWFVHWIRGWNLVAVQLFESAVETLDMNQGEKVAKVVRAQAMANQAFFLAWLGLAEKGYKLAKKSIEILEPLNEPIALYFAYHGFTLPAYYLAKKDEEKNANIQMLNIAQTLGDKWLRAFANFLYSVTTLRGKDLPAAEKLAVASLKESETNEDLIVQALALNTLGHIAKGRGDFLNAKNYYLRSLDISRKVQFRWAIGNTKKYLGQVARLMEEFVEAEEHFLQSLRIANDLGLDRDIANHLFEFASLRAAQDREEEAVEILGLLLQSPASNQERMESGRITENAEKLLAKLEENIPPEKISDLLNRGRGLELDNFLSRLLNPKNSS